MKQLADILKGIKAKSVTGDTSIPVTSLCLDSRKVEKGSVFFAVRGSIADGHAFIPAAIEKEASAIVCEERPADAATSVTWVIVDNTNAVVGPVACNLYGHPSKEFKLVGITGTNGKTTVATLLYELYTNLGYKCGLVSTVQNVIGKQPIPSTHTTPDAISLTSLLRKMADAGCSFVFMECSSHAIHQERIKGQKFAGGIFTNITHDHLDYHGTFDQYLKAKKKFFDELDSEAFALINKDDRNGSVMVQNTKATRYTYSLRGMADFRARIIEQDFRGMLLEIDGQEAWYRLTGHFNAYNLLAVYATTFLLGESKDQVIMGLSKLQPVRGRFEYIQSDEGIIGIVDYAHTPDALKNVLETINQVRTKNEQLITVIGCGGNRDAAKRSEMAAIAVELSTRAIFTSDNPRNEDPEAILEDMMKGVPGQHYKKALKITDRKEAIKTAVTLANKGDIILVAGKGHETYQEIKGVKHPFDDRAVLEELFR
ncbi:MAG TPA: UDP-N-acetylmuramoyl-L-alanyl-D-glutamate--2,6-diaminopimelate ligase [Bacteroidia bacterium]|nr:UDP-N-acetylmuramoyl-L-alanyl-D-glutamate--2,6-diaminopimelate ligase [Bacteroidia bacterium]